MVSPGGGDLTDTGRAYLSAMGRDGFDALLKKVIASLGCFGQLNAAEREDVAQEAVLRALTSRGLDPSYQPVAYIKKIARNMAIKKVDKLRRDGVSVLMDNADLNDLVCPGGNVEEAEREQDQDLVARVSQGLSEISSPQQREVTERRAGGEGAAQIAASLGISSQQVHTQYNRGRARVRSAPQVSPYVRAAYVQSASRVRPAEEGEGNA
ncbi:RNA polymerase sigma factor [Streptomyces sp. NPDC059783]|uniref:RNA polymerase sigma factor n=1 Tax=Streptomyces sp. NPDC059783 TaxID=3346944 RepID=UPI00364C9708